MKKSSEDEVNKTQKRGKAASKEEVDPAKKAPPPEDVQLSDVLLIMDKLELMIKAVSKVDKNGKAETVPAEKKHENSFFKFDRHSSLIENFIRNFWSQLNDPTRFGLFRLNFGEYKKNREAIKDLTEGKQTDRVKEFLKKYEIKPRNTESKNINPKNENDMAKQNQKPQTTAENSAAAENPTTATTQTATNPAQQSPTTEIPNYRYNASLINWDQMKNFGLSREYLQNSGLLEPMLKGYKTPVTVPLTLNFGSAVLRTDARLSLQQSMQGPIVLAIHGIRKEPELDKPFYGHIFSEEDKKNLRETGNMGRIAHLKGRTGDEIPSFISIDKLTNEVVALRVANAFIPDEVKGVKLTEPEKEQLKDGKAIYLEGMMSNKGKEFDGWIQINADRRGIEHSFESDRLFTNKTLYGVELTEKQMEALNEGKAVKLENMKRKDGDTFDAFVSLDKTTGRPVCNRFNPDSPESSREIIIPKDICGVKLTDEDRDNLSKDRPIFLNDMVNRKGETFNSYVRLDMETGQPRYSKSIDGFTEKKAYEIPTHILNVELSRAQRAQLQDGKVVLVKGIVGFDGKAIDQWAKSSQNTGQVYLYNENPDKVREASQRDVVKEKMDERQAKSQSQSSGSRKRSSQSVS